MKKHEKAGLSKLDYEGMQREKRNRAATVGKYALASTLGYPGIGAYQIARTYTNRDFTAMNNTNNISTRVSKKDREKLARKYNYIKG